MNIFRSNPNTVGFFLSLNNIKNYVFFFNFFLVIPKEPIFTKK